MIWTDRLTPDDVQATASIDVKTAFNIQQMLREELRESTVITIAHRVEAVKDADYSIVLEQGRLIHCGPTKEKELRRPQDTSGIHGMQI